MGEKAKIATLLVSGLRAALCNAAEGPEKKKLLSDEILYVQLVTTASFTSGYIVNPLSTEEMDHTPGTPASIARLVTKLLGTRTATRLLSSSTSFPWLSQSHNVRLNHLLVYFSRRFSSSMEITDRESATTYFSSPGDMTPLAPLTRAQRRRSKSSSSSSPERTIAEEKPPPNSSPPPPTPQGSQRPSLLSLPAKLRLGDNRKRTVVNEQWRGQKCPRKSEKPCRGKWWSKKNNRWETCAHGCPPK